MSVILDKISVWFCREFHDQITRPVNGKYYCLKCGKGFNSPWN